MNNYFSFTLNNDFEGVYSPVTSINYTLETIGNTKDPNDILKLNVGSDVFSQQPESVLFSNIDLKIETLTSSDWTTEEQEKWLNAYLKYVSLINKINPTQFSDILDYLLSINFFESISSPSIAYVNRNDGTNSYNDDFFYTNEVFIGLNVYESNILLDYANITNDLELKNIIISNHKKDKNYISNASKVTYQSFTNIVYCFDGICYDKYDISNIGLTPSLINGGGNIFGEVKLAGDGIQAHYKIRKNIHKNDPTVGYCSGVGKEQNVGFCMGDYIVLVDTTVWTTNTINGWTWCGDFTTLPYQWYIADVTKPCEYYSSVAIYEQLFPLRIIQYCLFSDFK